MQYSKEYQTFRKLIQLRLREEYDRSLDGKTIDDILAEYDEYRFSEKLQTVIDWSKEMASRILASTQERQPEADVLGKMVARVVLSHAHFSGEHGRLEYP